MIDSNTPSILAGIIRDTWPQLFWLKKEEPNMIGKLDPEENVMKNIPLGDIPNHDWTQNKDEYFAWEDNGIMDRIQDFIDNLGWESSDNIVVEIGGTQVSGVDVGEEYNKKWQSPLGTRKYNKDAFIVVKNLSRDLFEPSKPMESFNPHHTFDSEYNKNVKEIDDQNGYDTYSK